MAATKQNTSAETEKKIPYKLRKLPGKDANQDEFYSINGKDYIIKRGVTVEMPEELYNYIIEQERAEEEADRFSEEAAQKVNEF